MEQQLPLTYIFLTHPEIEISKKDIFKRVHTNINISPLSSRTINQAINLSKIVFPRENYDVIRMHFEESCHPGTHALELANHHISYPRYWIAQNQHHFLGFSGIYLKSDEPDAVWGGYTAVDASLSKFSARVTYLLLVKTMIEVRKTGRKYFRLFSGLIPEEARMNLIYDNYGFKIFRTEIDEFGDTIIYKEAVIDQIYETVRSKKIKNNNRTS